jgi:hypothetical protein
MNKTLKELFKIYYSPFKSDDRFYLKHFTKNVKYDNLNKHLVLSNLSKLLTLRSSDETIVMPIQILCSQFEEEYQKTLLVSSNTRTKTVISHESKLRLFLDCLSQNVLWLTHTVYDRTCNTNIAEGGTHYIWNKNIISMKQLVGGVIEVIVRNAAYNYRAKIECNNWVEQKSSGG